MDFANILDDLFLKLNQCRLHPKETATNLRQLHNQYRNNVFRQKYRTRQGQRALENLIIDLSQRQPTARRLKWSYALHMAADQQAHLLGSQGLYTTQGTFSHKTLPERVKDYAIVKGRISQVYQFGGRSADQILQQLLIDDGLMSRKRRTTLLDPIFNYIGIGTSLHDKNQVCTVIILAEDIVSLVAPDSQGNYIRRGLPTDKQNAIKFTQNVLLDIFGKAIQPIPVTPNNQNQINNLVPNLISQSVVRPLNQSTLNQSRQTANINPPNQPVITQNINQSRQTTNIYPPNQPVITQNLNQSRQTTNLNQSINNINPPNAMNQSIQSNRNTINDNIYQNPINPLNQSNRFTANQPVLQDPLNQSNRFTANQPIAQDPLNQSRQVSQMQQSAAYNPNFAILPPPQNNSSLGNLQSDLDNIRASNVTNFNSANNIRGSNVVPSTNFGANTGGQTVIYNNPMSNSIRQPSTGGQAIIYNNNAMNNSIRQPSVGGQTIIYNNNAMNNSIRQPSINPSVQQQSLFKNPSINQPINNQSVNLTNRVTQPQQQATIYRDPSITPGTIAQEQIMSYRDPSVAPGDLNTNRITDPNAQSNVNLYQTPGSQGSNVSIVPSPPQVPPVPQQKSRCNIM